jgi:hypothetical protein
MSVHLVVPVAAVDAAKQRWRRKRRGKNGTYLFNEKAMAKVFRAKMLAAIEAAGICLPARYPREWVAHCQSVGSGEKALIYLGRYLYRGIIREPDLPACENGRVSFRYRNATTGKVEKRSLAGADFLWLLLQHGAAQGVSSRAQLRLPARQLQAADRLAASLAEVRSQPLHATAQGAASDALLVLWCPDGDRQDADSIDIARRRRCAIARRSCHLIM